VVASGFERLDRLNAPSCCVSIRTPSEPVKGDPVHDGIRPERRCHLIFDLLRNVAVIRLETV
jgi:hypothetical protein